MPFDGVTENRIIRNLLPTKEVLVQHGWCQRTAQDEQGRMCVGGALSFAISGSAFHWYSPEFAETWHVLKNSFNKHYTPEYHLVDYNNNVAKNVDDIFTLLDKTIEDVKMSETV